MVTTTKMNFDSFS